MGKTRGFKVEDAITGLGERLIGDVIEDGLWLIEHVKLAAIKHLERLTIVATCIRFVGAFGGREALDDAMVGDGQGLHAEALGGRDVIFDIA